MVPIVCGPADPSLTRYALSVKVGEFVRDVAANHPFSEVCLAVAETRYLTYDHAVIVVEHRWPRWPWPQSRNALRNFPRCSTSSKACPDDRIAGVLAPAP